jgi:hypothetical protein
MFDKPTQVFCHASKLLLMNPVHLEMKSGKPEMWEMTVPALNRGVVFGGKSGSLMLNLSTPMLVVAVIAKRCQIDQSVQDILRRCFRKW